jgi:methyl-accepting chemotaxis protein
VSLHAPGLRTCDSEWRDNRNRPGRSEPRPISLVLADRPVFVDLSADPAAQEVLASPVSRFMLIALPTALAVVLAGLVTAAILVPLVAVASYRSLQGTARRLQGLADATGDLRLGALDMRVTVSGEDETGRLQAHFNAMAADLQSAVGELETERDNVARLLHERRELVANVSHELRPQWRRSERTSRQRSSTGSRPTLRRRFEPTWR